MQNYCRTMQRSHASRLSAPDESATSYVSRSSQAPPDQLLPHSGLGCVTWLGVREGKHVAQLDRSATVVLGELILVELAERRGQSLLHLPGERYTSVLPVDGEELGELIGTLDD